MLSICFSPLLFTRLMMRASCLLVARGHYHLCVVPLSLVWRVAGGLEMNISLSLVEANSPLIGQD